MSMGAAAGRNRRQRGRADRAPADLVVARQDPHHRRRRHILRRLRRAGDRDRAAGAGADVEAHAAADRAADLGGLPGPAHRRAVVRLDRRTLRPHAGDDRVDRDVRVDELRLRVRLGLQIAARVPHAARHRARRRGAGRRGLYQRTDHGPWHRGRFVLLYELVFPIGLVAAGLLGLWIVPTLGWQWMFYIGALPAILALFLRALLPESPRWLARAWPTGRSRGRDVDDRARDPEIDRRNRCRRCSRWCRPATSAASLSDLFGADLSAAHAGGLGDLVLRPISSTTAW